MDNEITLPITYNDLEAWRTELRELEPRLSQLYARSARLKRLIKAAEYFAEIKEHDRSQKPASE